MIFSLKLDGQTHPIGVDKPGDFSWLLNTKHCQKQAFYEIRVAFEEKGLAPDSSRLLWTSGRIESDETNGIPYEGPELISQTTYYWNVTVQYSDGTAETSETATWETGLIEPSDWTETWASSPYDRHGEYYVTTFDEKGNFNDTADKSELNRPVLFRKTFHIEKAIAKARLYATAHGVYEAQINGAPVSDTLLNPGYTSYDKMLCYQTYDVTDLLTQGDNALGFTVADGWYSGYIGGPGIPAEYGNDLSVLCQLDIEYTDETHEVLGSSEGFKCGFGKLIYSDLFIGEKQNLSLEQANWSCPDFDDSSWKQAVPVSFDTSNLLSNWYEPVRKTDRLMAVDTFTSPKGELLVDYGQVISGRTRLIIETEGPVTIQVEHTEVLDTEGNYTNNVMGANKDHLDVFTTTGGIEALEAVFAFHGFRYIRITADGPFTLLASEAYAIGSNLRETGTFSCDDPRLNRLMSNVRWSQKGNFLSIPTDCPQRERMGWTGDIQVFAPTAAFNMDTRGFLRTWLRNVRADQLSDGQIPNIVPFAPTYRDVVFASAGGVSSTGWGDAIIAVPWAQYQLLNDKRVLADCYQAMKKWIAYGTKCSEEGVPEKYRNTTDKATIDRQRYLWNTGFHWGDWLVPSIVLSNGEIDMFQSSLRTREIVAPAMFARSVRLMATIAGVLEHHEDQRRYEQQFAQIRRAYIEEYIKPDGTIASDYPLQGIYVMVLAFGLYPDELKDALVQHLVSMIEHNGGLLDTGFLATPYLLDVLVDTGHSDLAYRLLFEERCPSWLYEVKMGATTTWESWQAILEDGTPTDVSYNHYANGCVADFIYRHIGGLTATTPGYRTFDIAPDYSCGLHEVHLSYDSVCGLIAVNWERNGSSVKLEVTVPQNTTARIRKGDTWQTVGGGTHRFLDSLPVA